MSENREPKLPFCRMLSLVKTLSVETIRKIIARRDPRYDGRFYFGVKTTGIYCRTICPARPKAENILVFKSTTEAEKNGFRPCLRCKPDAAPGSKVLDGTLNSVARALKLIEEDTNSEPTIDSLASKLGISDRHLRRLFEEHLGASPIEIMISRRLHLAKTLILHTQTPLSEIALATGFQSVRRFNEAFRALYRQTPSHFRKDQNGSDSNSFELKLPVHKPYDLKLVLAYFARHEAYGIERVTSQTYTRFIPQGKTFGTLELKLDSSQEFMHLKLTNLPLTRIREVLIKLKNLFDLDHNPIHLPKTKDLKTKGVRVPGSYDAFETVVSIVLSQLVSTEAARTKLKQVIERFGTQIGSDSAGPIYAFPEPGKLQSAKLEEIGITRVKAGAIREIAKLVHEKKISLSKAADLEQTRSRLLAIKGFGPWTVEMIAMRCLGDSDAFPKNDLIIKRALEELSFQDDLFESFRAYLTHCLWRDYGGKKP